MAERPPCVNCPAFLPMDLQAAKQFILAQLHAGLPDFRTYHSLEHTLDVHAAAVRLAAGEGIAGEDLALLETAALFHDSGFLVRPNDHESGSCLIAREALPRFGYSDAQVDRVCGLIMSTVVPQAADDALSNVLCDADLDYLGRDDFFLIGDRLFRELMAMGAIADRKEWDRLQVSFLSRHVYYTAASRTLREPRKQEHLAEVRRRLAGQS